MIDPPYPRIAALGKSDRSHVPRYAARDVSQSGYAHGLRKAGQKRQRRNSLPGTSENATISICFSLGYYSSTSDGGDPRDSIRITISQIKYLLITSFRDRMMTRAMYRSIARAFPRSDRASFLITREFDNASENRGATLTLGNSFSAYSAK